MFHKSASNIIALALGCLIGNVVGTAIGLTLLHWLEMWGN